MTREARNVTLGEIRRERVLVTGAAGFIGFHLCQRLLQEGATVLGVDNFSPYYDVSLKEARYRLLCDYSNFSLARAGIENLEVLERVWGPFAPTVVIHLAAQAGVRYSIDHPDVYVQTNLVGTFNVLELARRYPVAHMLAASTSSVYGGNASAPSTETDRTAAPLSLYAATKAGGEQMGHSYAHVFRIPMTFFRFFTVYGPWGRPDMAYFKFAKAMFSGQPLEIYNFGDMARDFTFVDDLVESVLRLVPVIPDTNPVEHDSLSPVAPFRIVNIGKGKPDRLMDYVEALESALGIRAQKLLMPMQVGDALSSWASPDLLMRLTGYAPTTPLSVGVPRFVEWFRAMYAT